MRLQRVETQTRITLSRNPGRAARRRAIVTRLASSWSGTKGVRRTDVGTVGDGFRRRVTSAREPPGDGVRNAGRPGES